MISGAGGQLGQALETRLQPKHEVLSLGRDQLDVTSRRGVDAVIARERPEWVINAAAYTAVDAAEEHGGSVVSVNAEAPGWLAESCTAHGARLVHFSTDFVFSGSQSTPYTETEAPDPVSVYGITKLQGERRALEATDAVVLRTAWLYSHLQGNFVSTMLKLHKIGEPFSVVYDQVGSPTWVETVAEATSRVIGKGLATGVYHCVDAGVASRYDLARAVGEEAVELGLVSREAKITPIRSAEYPLPAARPAFSVLDCARFRNDADIVLPYWRDSLRQCLRRLVDE